MARRIRAAILGAAAMLAAQAAWPQQPATTTPVQPSQPVVYHGEGLQGGEYEIAPAAAAQQEARIETALAALKPQRAGVHDVYVITAALWGEHVFESEATQAADLLIQRYGADGRAIVLSNDTGDASRGLPAATPAHIFAVLNRIGALMDKNEDLLLLFFTSHGGPNAGISIVEPKRMQYVISPSDLHAALDKAGITHRVLILSACYSGQFIPAFRDQDTILLTAASADHPSFGCAPERDWTYFGDAFFNHALRAGGGLVPAFQRAKKQITEWELRDGQTPSDPQLYVGVNAAKILGAVEANLPPAAATAAASSATSQ